MNDLETRLRKTLDGQAGRIVDPDPEGRAQLVIQQAASGHGRRNALIAGLVALALGATGVYVGIGQGREAVPAPNPLGTTTPSVVPSPVSSSSTPGREPSNEQGSDFGLPTPSLPATTDPMRAAATLPQGRAAGHLPREASIDGKPALVSSLGTTLLPAGQSGVAELVEVADGLVLRTMSREYTGGGPDAASVVLKVGRDGTMKTWSNPAAASHLVASPDGSQVAWLVPAELKSGVPEVQVRDASTGRRLGSHRLAGNDVGVAAIEVRLVAWTSEGIVLTGAPNVAPVWILDPATGTTRRLAGRTWNLAQVGNGELVVVRAEGDRQCADLGPTTTGAQRQVVCAPEVLLSRALNQTVQVLTTPGPAVSAKVADSRVWVVQRDGRVISGIKPGWVQQYIGQESPTTWIMDCQVEAQRPCRVRWDLAAGRLERVG